MTQITSTNDATNARVITFGGTPLVKWYAYLRAGEIYMRREEAGVIGVETKILEMLGTAKVADFDFVVDPDDAGQAWIYFVTTAGSSYRFGVNSTPVGEHPTLQSLDEDEDALTIMAVNFQDTQVFDGDTYTVDSAKLHTVIAEHNASMSYTPGLKYHVRAANGSPYGVVCIDVKKAGDGRVAATFSFQGGATISSQNVEFYNGDGTLGTTLTVSMNGLALNSVGMVAVWDANGDVVWADQCVLSVSGVGTGTPSWISRNIAFTPDETEVIFTFQVSWSSNIATNHVYDLLPNTNTPGTQRKTLIQSQDITVFIVRANAGTGAIQDYEIVSVTATSSEYAVNYQNLVSQVLEYTPSGFFPLLTRHGRSGYSGTYTWKLTGTAANTEPRLYEGFDDIGGIYLVDHATMSARYALTLYYNSGSTPARNGANTTVTTNAIPLSDNGVVVMFYEGETSPGSFNRGTVVGRDLNTSGSANPSEQLLCRTRRFGGLHGGNCSAIMRLRDNPLDPTNPEVVWIENYGSNTSSTVNGVYQDNNISWCVVDEPGNRMFVAGVAKCTQYWTGSRYINTTPVYGKDAGSRSMIFMSLDMTDGRELWSAIVQSNGVLGNMSGAPMVLVSASEVWMAMYFEEEAIFDYGLASEVTLTAVGIRRQGYAVYGADDGVFLRWEEISDVAGGSFYPHNNYVRAQKGFPADPGSLIPDMFYFSFDLEDKESINVYTDLTGNSRHATWVGSPVGSGTGERENEGGKIGETINLGGASSNYLDIANSSSASPLDQWTFCFWIVNYNSTSSDTDHPILSKSDLGSNKELEIGVVRKASLSWDSEIYVRVSTTGSNDIRLTYAVPRTDPLNNVYGNAFGAAVRLQHVAVTFHAAEGLKIFYNGVEVAADNTAHGNLNRSSYNMRIARNQDPGTEPIFNGDGDEFAAYTQRLTPTEIARIYERGRLGIKLNEVV